MLDGISFSVLSEVSAWFVLAGVMLVIFRMIYKGKLVPEPTVMMLHRTIDTQADIIKTQNETIREYQAIGLAGVHIMEAMHSPPEEEGNTS